MNTYDVCMISVFLLGCARDIKNLCDGARHGLVNPKDHRLPRGNLEKPRAKAPGEAAPSFRPVHGSKASECGCVFSAAPALHLRLDHIERLRQHRRAHAYCKTGRRPMPPPISSF